MRAAALFAIIALVASGYSALLNNPLIAGTWYLYLPSNFLAGCISVLVASKTLKVNRLAALAALIVLFVLIPVGSLPERIGDYSLLLGGIIGYLAAGNRILKRRNPILWLAAILLSWVVFVADTWSSGAGFASVEPTGNGWKFDPIASVKIFYLMKRGMGYYNAYLTASILNAGLDPAKVSALSFGQGSTFFIWRAPFLFYLWLLIPNGATLYGTYILLCSAAIVCAYFAFSKTSKRTGLLAATMLMPYFTSGLNGGWWLEWEFWGSLFSIFAFTLYFRKQRRAAVIPAVMAALCKDTLAVALVGGVLGSAVRRDKKEVFWWVAGSAVYAGYTALNYLYFLQSLHVTTALSRWAGQGGVGFVEATFRFMTPWLGSGWIWILIALAIVGVCIIRPLNLAVYAFSVTLIPVVAFMEFGFTYDVYWGAVYVAFILLTVAYSATTLQRRKRIGADPTATHDSPDQVRSDASKLASAPLGQLSAEPSELRSGEIINSP